MAPAIMATRTPHRSSAKDRRLLTTLGTLAGLVRLHVGSFAAAELDSPLLYRRQSE